MVLVATKIVKIFLVLILILKVNVDFEISVVVKSLYTYGLN